MYEGLKIRILVINGVLKVQVGEWTEKTGHREPGQGSGQWLAWDTVTTFPLFLQALDHYLPPRFLLLDYFSSLSHRKHWSRDKKAFFRHADEYRRVLSTWGEYRENRLQDRQAKQFDQWLTREGFRRTWEDSQPPLQPSWSNPVMRIDLNYVQVDYDTYRWLSDEGEKVYG